MEWLLLNDETFYHSNFPSTAHVRICKKKGMIDDFFSKGADSAER